MRQEPALGLEMEHVRDIDTVPLGFAMVSLRAHMNQLCTHCVSGRLHACQVQRHMWKKRFMLDLRYAPRSYEVGATLPTSQK